MSAAFFWLKIFERFCWVVAITIKPGTSLVEHYALNPSTYSNKGYKNSRTIKKHPDLVHGKSVESNVLAKANTTKLRRMNLEDYQKRSDNFDAGNDTPSDQSPYPTSEDFSDVNPLPQS